MFKRDSGIFAVHIPCNGGNPAQLALLSGQVDFNFDHLATAAPNIRSGKLKGDPAPEPGLRHPLNSPESRTRFATLMAEPVPTTPQQFGAFIRAELAKYEKVVKASGAKVD